MVINKQYLVLVIDDDPSVRRALDNLLRSVGYDVQCFESVSDFQQKQIPNVPACLVLDVKMPGVNGIEFQRELVGAGCTIPIIFITGHGDIPMSVRAIKDGAIEFLTKPFCEHDLLKAIQDGLNRAQALRQEAAVCSDLLARYQNLSVREREVMSLVVTGRLNKQIAAALNLSEIMVKVYRGNVMRKMQATSFADLVRMADKIAAVLKGVVC